MVAAGPKVLYEDRSIRQAGLTFERDATGGWRPVHLYAGMPSSRPAANEGRRVPALTRAGLLVTRSEFTEVGGFDTAYASGTYADSDLSLRLQASGRTCRYVPEAELYDLEDQSPPSAQRGRAAYDRWLFNHRWSAGVDELIDELGAGRPVGRAMPAGSR